MAIYGLEEVEDLVVDRILAAWIPFVPFLND
jgi:hypothetical protein